MSAGGSGKSRHGVDGKSRGDAEGAQLQGATNHRITAVGPLAPGANFGAVTHRTDGGLFFGIKPALGEIKEVTTRGIRNSPVLRMHFHAVLKFERSISDRITNLGIGTPRQFVVSSRHR